MIKVILILLLQQADTFHISTCNTEKYKKVDYSKYDLSKYTYIDLSCSDLTSINHLALNNAIYLNLRNNPLTNLDSKDLKNLELIDVTGTGILDFNQAACLLPKLKSITNEGGITKSFPECFCDNPGFEIFNFEGTYSPLPTGIKRCKYLRNLSLFFTDDLDKTKNDFILIDQLESITRLSLTRVSSIDLLPSTKKKITSLAIVPRSDSDLKNIVPQLKDFVNLRQLEITMNSKVFTYDISFLDKIETLTIKRFGGSQKVKLPDYILKFHNIKSIFDFDNLIKLKLRKDIQIIKSNGSDVFGLKKSGFVVIDYVDPLLIK